MRHESPVAQLLRQAQQLQNEELDSDDEDELSISTQVLGVPRRWLEDDYESNSPSTSDRDDSLSGCIQQLSLQRGSLDCAAHLRQQQQAELQHILGIHSCRQHQIDCAEDWGLQDIAAEHAQRQGHLIWEDAQYRDKLALQREGTLQALRQQHHAKAQHNQQVQETIASQEQALQQQQKQEEQQRAELEAQRRQQEEAKQAVEEPRRQQQLQEQQKQQQEQQQQQKQAQSQAAQVQQQQPPVSQQQQQQQVQQPQPRLSSDAAPPAVLAHSAASEPQVDASDPSSLLRIAESAAEEEAKYRAALEKAEAEISSYVGNDSSACKKERRDIEKQLLKLVQQVSGTQEQVKNKSSAILRLFSQLSGHQLTFAYLQLARKLLLQCENQIMLNPRSGFPFAEVAAAVAAQHATFGVLLVAKLHEACPLSVPKCYLNPKGSHSQYCKLMRYATVPDPKTGQAGLEKHEAYMRRNGGIIIFYAAVMQSQWPGNPMSLDTAWQYIARLLNALPANRAAATALFAFLQVAGYRLWQVYQGQFIKLLKYIFDHFHPKLVQSSDPDIKAIAARVGQYISQHAYRQVPEGQQLPTHDESTDLCLNR